MKSKVSIPRLFRKINNVLCIDAELIGHSLIHNTENQNIIFTCDYGEAVSLDNKKYVYINYDKVIEEFNNKNSLLNIGTLLKPYDPENIDLVFVAFLILLLSSIQATYEKSEHYASNAAGKMSKWGVDSGAVLQYYYDEDPNALSQNDNFKDTYITNLFKCYKIISKLSKK